MNKHFLFLLSLLLIPFFLTAQENESEKVSNENAIKAEELVKKAQSGVTSIIKEARKAKDPALEPDSASAKPFWQAVKRLNESLEKAERGLFLKDESFFQGIAGASISTAEADVALEMSGSKSPGVREALNKTTTACNLLMENFSKEGVRAKKDEKLTAAQSKKLDDLKKKQKELEAKLDSMEKKVAKNESLVKGIKKMKEKSREITHCHHTTHGYHTAFFTMNIMMGWMWAYHWWWGPYGYWGPPVIYDYYGIYIDHITIVDYDWIVVEDAIILEDAYMDELAFDVAAEEITAVDHLLDHYSFELDEQEYMDLADDIYDPGLDAETMPGMDLEGDIPAGTMDGLDDGAGFDLDAAPQPDLNDQMPFDGGGLDGFDNMQSPGSDFFDLGGSPGIDAPAMDHFDDAAFDFGGDWD